MKQARVRIARRRTSWIDRFRPYEVRIDGEQVGGIGNGEEKTFAVRPGRIEVQLAIDWGRSRPVRLELAAGDEAELLCHGRNPLLVPFWITAGRNRYIALERVG